VRIRTSLLALSLATAAPLLAFAVFAAWYTFQRENAAFLNASLTRNRATLQAVDAQLTGTINTLRALASSESIGRNDYAGFHREAAVVLGTQPHWQNIVLLTPHGAQVVSARLPWGTPLPRHPDDRRSFQVAAVEKRPSVSDISFASQLHDEPGIVVRLPVERGGETINILTAVLKISGFQEILEQQRLPREWISGLVGTDGRLIARVPPVPPGTLAGANYREAVSKSGEGWYRGVTIEGADTYTAFSRSDMTGWTVGYAIPSQAIVGGPYRAGALIGLGILLSLASATGIGFVLSRRIAEPIAQLASSARHLGSGASTTDIASVIEEIAALGRALREADSAIADRDRELVRRGQELLEQSHELRQADASKTRFLAFVSHELRSPLAPLRNGLQLLERVKDEHKHAEVRTMMRRQISLMERLIGDLIDLGRISRGDFDLRRQELSLDAIVQASVDDVMALVQGKGQSLVVRHAPSALHVSGDSQRLQQVVTNLLTNANRYTLKGGHIVVELTREGDHALITVADDGAGFRAEDAARMFEMFVRLGTHTDTPGSLGIGLAVARTIIQLHDGRIEAASEGPGRGARFTVYLPLSMALTESDEIVGATAASGEAGQQ
jgi:signal transduction histidine kinase